MRPRVAAGVAFVVAGSALVAWAGNSYARGWLSQERARSAWEQRVARAEVERGRALANGSAAPGGAAEGAPVARLLIPKIGLDDIILEGVTPVALNGGPGHLPGSALPGSKGNAVISAHRDRHFKRLGELIIGDTVETQTIDNRVTWTIIGRKVVSREAPVIRTEPGEVLTLTTCWPIGYLGGAPDRLILRAVPVGRARAVGVATNAEQSPR